MTKEEYRSSLESLGLSQKAAGRWLGVSEKTAHNYATKGPSGPAAVAIRMAATLAGVYRYDLEHDPRFDWAAMVPYVEGDYVRFADVASAVGLTALRHGLGEQG